MSRGMEKAGRRHSRIKVVGEGRKRVRRWYDMEGCQQREWEGSAGSRAPCWALRPDVEVLDSVPAQIKMS